MVRPSEGPGHMTSGNEIHRAVSLLVRDLTISAKRLGDVARDFYALADTCRLALASTQPPVLVTKVTREDGKAAAPADPFSYPLSESHD